MAARLIVDEPSRGSWNMAVDEMLLESAAATGRVTLRFYQWSEPTLSLGYFQNHSHRATHVASAGCPLVRRATGGGAILHDRELTYSFTAPIHDRVAADVQLLYDAFHETLVAELDTVGVTAKLCANPPRLRAGDEPFLCFQRRASGDVLCRESKICGSAQRRHQGAVLQHGSLLLETSPCAPELPGIQQICGVALEVASLRDRWMNRVVQRLGISVQPELLTPTEIARADDIDRQRFNNSQWNHRR